MSARSCAMESFACATGFRRQIAPFFCHFDFSSVCAAASAENSIRSLDNASSSNATRVDNIEPIVDPNEQVMDIINDAFPFASTNINQEGEDDMPTPMDSAEFEQYEQLLKSANQELYPGCESFSVLTAIVELMHGKIKYRMSNLYHRQAQKVLNGLGLGYEKIHACKNNCMLFYKEYETLDTCPICKESRFKMTSQNRTTKIP
ncbi:unnamed protein product, partial [Prunus brigantina]